MKETARKLQQLDPLRAARVEMLAARFKPPTLQRAVISDRGERWNSTREAAIALGFSRDSVNHAISRRERRGGRFLAYEGNPLPAATVKACIVCRATGESWPSALACAKSLGICDMTVHRRIRDGREVCGRKIERGPNWGWQRGWFGKRKAAA